MNPYAQSAPHMGPPPGAPVPEPTDTSWIRRRFCDISYGSAEPQKFNVYLPNEGEGPFPTVVFIHGGAFSGGDRTDPQLRPFLELVKYGLALVSVDHRLSGEVVFPEGLRDCAQALRFIRDNGKQWRLDTDKIALLGNSAGGNFVLMLAAAQTAPLLQTADPNARPVDVKCVVTWFAPTDFLACIEAFRQERDPRVSSDIVHDDPYSPESVYLGGPILELDPDYVRSADPISYITPELPPILMQHGRLDHVVHWTQSKLFADRVNAVCGEDHALLDILPEADHADPAFETEENMERVARFFQAHLA